MAVAHDAVSESHTGTAGSTNEASFSWTHTPVGTPAGVLVFVFSRSSTQHVSAVTYGGSSLTEVPGGRAVDTVAGELMDCVAYFLGSAVPTGAQSVVVTRTNDAIEMYAAAITVTAGANTETTGVVLLEEDGTFSEQSVDDGSPGTNSVRYAGAHTGSGSVPGVGANTTALVDMDYSATTTAIAVARETTAGQGARLVGFSSGVADDRAAVHLAVREAAAGAPQPSAEFVDRRPLDAMTRTSRQMRSC